MALLKLPQRLCPICTALYAEEILTSRVTAIWTGPQGTLSRIGLALAARMVHVYQPPRTYRGSVMQPSFVITPDSTLHSSALVFAGPRRLVMESKPKVSHSFSFRTESGNAAANMSNWHVVSFAPLLVKDPRLDGHCSLCSFKFGQVIVRRWLSACLT